MTYSKNIYGVKFCSAGLKMLHVSSVVSAVEFLQILVRAFCKKRYPLVFDREFLFVNASIIVCIHILKQNKR